jgi:hypothetical protein
MTTFTVITVASAIAAICLAYAWLVARNERERSAARIAALAAAIDGSPAETTQGSMFARGAGSMVQGRPLLKVAIGFGMAVFVIVVVAMTGDRHAGPDAAVVEEPRAEALELLSMRHTRAGDTLTVTGLVRNPATAASGDIMAVVFVFDRDGGFLGSGRAPLEFATIADGDESPFKVTVPEVKDVSRYRVSFRTGNGVVRHVDRRPAVAGAAGATAALQMSSN